MLVHAEVYNKHYKHKNTTSIFKHNKGNEPPYTHFD